MKKLCDFNKSKYSIIVASVIIFAVMLVFNFMTPYLADDYVYRYSFEDAKLITSITQIPSSMYYHSQMMNGRVISHGFEQLFMVFPKYVFNIVNAIVFTACLYIIYKMCMPQKKNNLCVYLLVFAFIWHFTPAFGQVYLWQVGAVNYLWAIFFALIFLYPYVDAYKNKTPMIKNMPLFVAFNVFAVIVGMYSEIASFIAIAAAVVLVILSYFIDKEKITVKKVLPVLFAIIGFVLLLMMPVEITAKVSEGLSFKTLIDNFGSCTKMLDSNLKVLLIIWAILLVLGLYNKKKKNYKNVILSVVIALLGIASNYMMIIGTYFPERTMFVASTFLIMACFVMATELIGSNYEVTVSALAMVFCVVFAFSFVYGAYDIYNCHSKFVEREAEIAERRDNGERDLALRIIYPQTKHSAFYDVVDLNCDSTDAWPNVTVAWYYGVDSIIGVR